MQKENRWHINPASILFQEIEEIKSKHPDVREVLIDSSCHLDYDRIITGWDSVSYCSWMTYYNDEYWDDEDELRDYLYEVKEMDEEEIDEVIARLDVFDAIIIYGV